ncbi:hypothetical protein ECEC1737_3243 [Escherichia coli EC1737]|nr:hypothetical protein ECFRIK1990_3448 [Escherichia coli FRIK1990]EKI65395.1 hypothetical protein ECEC1737_3243 [Escherichia coli EC1737]EKY38475.1 hypothetical protein EC960109_3401 [Escherichia coli 96.0109]
MGTPCAVTLAPLLTKTFFYILYGPIQIINIVGITWMHSLCKITNCFF